MKKPIYNWVLANPVLYEKPILNVKETFLWDPTPNQECMVVIKAFGQDVEYCNSGRDWMYGTSRRTSCLLGRMLY
jgi:hypothetical protein